MEDLEQKIEHARQKMTVASKPAERRSWLRVMTRLIKKRTPQRVLQMEREQGLRP